MMGIALILCRGVSRVRPTLHTPKQYSHSGSFLGRAAFTRAYLHVRDASAGGSFRMSARASYPDPSQVYGISDEMRLLSRARDPSPGPHTALLSSFLVAHRAAHQDAHPKGAFGLGFGRQVEGSWDKKTLRHWQRQLYVAVDSLMGLSPGVCRPGLSIHIAHDLGSLKPRKGWNATYQRHHTNGSVVVEHRADGMMNYHSFPRDLDHLPTDRRYQLFAAVLRHIKWDCAFTLDLTDVVVVHVPACSALPNKLMIGSDGQSPKVRRWLFSRANRTRLLPTLSAAFNTFGDRSARSDAPAVLNCGIVGGRRSAFEPALSAFNQALLTHWQTNPSFEHGAEMVIWNDLALDRHRVPALSGYPNGAVNWPMYGSFAPQHRDVRGRPCVSRCRTEWFNLSMGVFWFGHKLLPVFMRKLVLGEVASMKQYEGMLWSDPGALARRLRLNGIGCSRVMTPTGHG